MNIVENLQGLSDLQTAFSLGMISAIIAFLFYRNNFFSLKQTSPLTINIRLAFLGCLSYLFIAIFFPPLLYKLLLLSFKGLNSPISLMTAAQFGSTLLMIAFLITFSLIQPKKTNAAIWIGLQKLSWNFFRKNVGIGALTWFLCFPIALFFSYLAQMFCTFFWGILPTEQLAVKFLRLISKSTSLTLLTLFSILIAAPILEEWVFRGFLQTYFKQKWGYHHALFLSSTIFSLFHLSLSQGLSNIPLLISLFILALFLGFLYEKQRSLIAPVTLHITFNSISVVRILF